MRFTENISWTSEILPEKVREKFRDRFDRKDTGRSLTDNLDKDFIFSMKNKKKFIFFSN